MKLGSFLENVQDIKYYTTVLVEHKGTFVSFKFLTAFHKLYIHDMLLALSKLASHNYICLLTADC